MSEQVNLTEMSVTGKASQRLCAIFLELTKSHPKGEQFVLDRLGPPCIGLMLMLREAKSSASACSTPAQSAAAFDAVSGTAWALTFGPSIDRRILLAALSNSAIEETVKKSLEGWIATRMKEQVEGDAPIMIWSIINAFLIQYPKQSFQFAASLMDELTLHMQELLE